VTVTPKKIFVIAGEASGDVLGARLMSALKNVVPGAAFTGIGGARMSEAGLNSLFPMQELALMGLAEILPKILRLRRRLQETIAAIKAENPDVLVTIDSPGFCLRVLKAVQGEKIKRLVGRIALPAALRAGIFCPVRPEPPLHRPPRARIRRRPGQRRQIPRHP
jgi:lipid-A-disaccharide synthase